LRPPDTAPVLIYFNYDAHAKFEVAQPIPCHRIAFYCWYITLHYDPDLWPLTLNTCGIPTMSWSNSVPNLSEIGQSAAELRVQYLT